jgi:hypothetical protein
MRRGCVTQVSDPRRSQQRTADGMEVPPAADTLPHLQPVPIADVVQLMSESVDLDNKEFTPESEAFIQCIVAHYVTLVTTEAASIGAQRVDPRMTVTSEDIKDALSSIGESAHPRLPTPHLVLGTGDLTFAPPLWRACQV